MTPKGISQRRLKILLGTAVCLAIAWPFLYRLGMAVIAARDSRLAAEHARPMRRPSARRPSPALQQTDSPNLSRIIRQTSNPRRPYELTPGQVVELDGTVYKINSHGYRGVPRPKETTHGVCRIGFLGGSSVFGVGLPEDETLPAMLKESLGNDFEVLNLGLPRANLIVAIEQYQHFAAMGYAFDRLIFYVDEFAFDMPGWSWVTKEPVRTIATPANIEAMLKPVTFDGLSFRFEPNLSYRFWAALYGPTNGVAALRSLDPQATPLFILDDVYSSVRPDHTTARRFEFTLWRIASVCRVRQWPVLRLDETNDALIRELKLHRSSQLFMTKRDRVPISAKRSRIVSLLKETLLAATSDAEAS